MGRREEGHPKPGDGGGRARSEPRGAWGAGGGDARCLRGWGGKGRGPPNLGRGVSRGGRGGGKGVPARAGPSPTVARRRGQRGGGLQEARGARTRAGARARARSPAAGPGAGRPLVPLHEAAGRERGARPLRARAGLAAPPWPAPSSSASASASSAEGRRLSGAPPAPTRAAPPRAAPGAPGRTSERRSRAAPRRAPSATDQLPPPTSHARDARRARGTPGVVVRAARRRRLPPLGRFQPRG